MLEVDKPFQIRTVGPEPQFVRGLDTQAEADASCVERNEAAVKLGIVARYVVVANS